MLPEPHESIAARPIVHARGGPAPARPISVEYASLPIAPEICYPRTLLTPPEAWRDLAVAVGVLGAFSLFSIFSGCVYFLEELVPRGGQFIWVLANGTLSLYVVSRLLRRTGQSPRDLGLARTRPSVILLGTLAAVPAAYALGAVSNLVVTALSRKDLLAFARERGDFFQEISDIPVGWVLPLSLFVGVYEEILFRGFLLTRLRALCSSNAAPILISSVVFGSLHFTQGVAGMCQTAVVGMVLAVVATRARTLWPAILAHAAVDSISLLISVLFAEDLQQMLKEISTQPAG